MNLAKILFIGLGGAGQRHMRIFRELLPADKTDFIAYRYTHKTPLLHSDFTIDSNNTIEALYQVKLFDDLKVAFAEKPDLTVIATPTACHREFMFLAIEAGSGVFVEKPWAESLEGFSIFREKLLAKNLAFCISFQRRFHPLIKKAHNIVASGLIGKLMTATFIVYSDVTTWHSYEDWHDLYAVHAELGGGVLLTEIHEIDLVNWFFGLPDKVFCSGGNRYSESLDVEDTVQLTFIYPEFSVQVTLCFVHKRISRSFHIAGTNGDLYWHDANNELIFTPSELNPTLHSELNFTNDVMFKEQAKFFIYNWNQYYTEEALKSAANSLAIVEAAKCSMQSCLAEPIKLI